METQLSEHLNIAARSKLWHTLQSFVNPESNMIDFAKRREVMVDTQIRPSDVTKFPVLKAMMDVPREMFVPRDKRDIAYIGESVELGNGRVVLDPRILAKLLDALDLSNDELVLDIGAGLGYSSALMAQLSEAVVAVEEDDGFIKEAEEALREINVDNVCVEQAALAAGAPEHGPYDVIVMQGAVETIPETVLSQLKEGGRIGCIVVEQGVGKAQIGYKRNGKISWRFAFNAGAPVLSGYERERAFAL